MVAVPRLVGLIRTTLAQSRCLPFLGPRGLPIVGMALELTPHAALKKMMMWSDTYGGTFAFWIFFTPAIVTSDLKVIREVMRDSPKIYSQKIRKSRLLDELTMPTLLTANGDEWKMHRRMTAPAFSEKNVDAMLSTIAEISRRLVNQLPKETSHSGTVSRRADPLKWFRLVTLDITFAVSQGEDWGFLDSSPRSGVVLKMVENFLDGITFVMMNSGMATMIQNRFPWNLNPRVRRAHAALKRAAHFTRNAIDKRRAELEAGEEPRKDILDQLIQSDTDALGGNLLGFIVAGSETVAISLSWLTYTLCKYPDVQAKARAEAMSLGHDPTTADDLVNLPYLEACVLENIRVQAVDQIFPRVNSEPSEIDGKPVAANTVVILLLGRALIHPARGGTDFKPERWLGSDGKVDRNHMKDIPIFGDGPRVCPGRLLAVKEIVIIAATLLRHCSDIRLSRPSLEVGTRVNLTRTPTNLYLDLEFRV
ncbi:hypothetical protein FOZ60_000357 [Perkinsus olseni]|uniref:Cytochrome P450 n=1 Tax=Perkinsus olseni TaxID=32597 RepID=A0A7J6MZL7_PEROL|nr:hypothetical protein FOZ60_000357 [Perkinsus olseni]